jgi:plastocyanin
MRNVFVIAGLLLATISCGDDNTTEPTPNPTDATITITSTGTSPQNVEINAGGHITWINNDTVQHQPSSDPHPIHTDCPGLNMNVLNPNQQATSAALTTRRNCGYHDHLNDTNAAFRGTVTVR